MTRDIINLHADYDHQSTIVISNDSISELDTIVDFDGYSHIFVLTDSAVHKSLSMAFRKFSDSLSSLYVMQPGEDQKSIASVQQIWKAMHDAGCDRSSLLVSIGGGVISDLGSFCAATYMRGIAHVNVPTTLLSQVDASVGGKNGFNFDGIKNLIGTFNQPDFVVIDPKLLKTLPDRQFVAGFAEIIKHGLIYDKAYFLAATSKAPKEYSDEELENLITGSCRIKHEIISKDVTEKNSRKTVNFGHTVGHAVESVSHDTSRPLLHGEAVSIGMVAESVISEKHGLISGEDVSIVRNSLLHAGLPVFYNGELGGSFSRALRSDKKNLHGDIRCTLLSGIGSVSLDQSVSDDEILAAMRSLKEKAS